MFNSFCLELLQRRFQFIYCRKIRTALSILASRKRGTSYICCYAKLINSNASLAGASFNGISRVLCTI